MTNAPCPLRVLVMDDEDTILKVYALLLSKLGHKAVCAISVDAALTAFKDAQAAGHPFDVVILDLNMGEGEGGREALAAMRLVEPGIRAIVSSGLSSRRMAVECSQHGFNTSISKPFCAQAVADAFKRIM